MSLENIYINANRVDVPLINALIIFGNFPEKHILDKITGSCRSVNGIYGMFSYLACDNVLLIRL